MSIPCACGGTALASWQEAHHEKGGEVPENLVQCLQDAPRPGAPPNFRRKRWASKARKVFCVRWLVARHSCTILPIGSCFITRAIHACLYESRQNLVAYTGRASCAYHGNFPSLEDLRDQILAFIAYDHRTMVKPIKFTYTGLAPDHGDM